MTPVSSWQNLKPTTDLRHNKNVPAKFLGAVVHESRRSAVQWSGWSAVRVLIKRSACTASTTDVDVIHLTSFRTATPGVTLSTSGDRVQWWLWKIQSRVEWQSGCRGSSYGRDVSSSSTARQRWADVVGAVSCQYSDVTPTELLVSTAAHSARSTAPLSAAAGAAAAWAGAWRCSGRQRGVSSTLFDCCRVIIGVPWASPTTSDTGPRHVRWHYRWQHTWQNFTSTTAHRWWQIASQKNRYKLLFHENF